MQLDNLHWPAIHQALQTSGYALLPNILTAEACHLLREQYHHPTGYRTTIDMARYRFGVGEYKYFDYPLPFMIQTLRAQWYTGLVPLARQWAMHQSGTVYYPDQHADFIHHCHAHGQSRPTPLILRYEAGGYNTLHQDLYGDCYFPFQVLLLLSQPDVDFTGGHVVLTEQVPRAQSRAHVVSPRQGDALVFTTRYRPVQGTRGVYQANIRHGVSEITTGIRYALGLIFHDAS